MEDSILAGVARMVPEMTFEKREDEEYYLRFDIKDLIGSVRVHAESRDFVPVFVLTDSATDEERCTIHRDKFQDIAALRGSKKAVKTLVSAILEGVWEYNDGADVIAADIEYILGDRDVPVAG